MLPHVCIKFEICTVNPDKFLNICTAHAGLQSCDYAIVSSHDHADTDISELIDYHVYGVCISNTINISGK